FTPTLEAVEESVFVPLVVCIVPVPRYARRSSQQLLHVEYACAETAGQIAPFLGRVFECASECLDSAPTPIIAGTKCFLMRCEPGCSCCGNVRCRIACPAAKAIILLPALIPNRYIHILTRCSDVDPIASA